MINKHDGHWNRSRHKFNKEEWRYQEGGGGGGGGAASAGLQFAGDVTKEVGGYMRRRGAEKKLKEGLQQDELAAQRAASGIRSQYGAYAEGAGFKPGEREARLNTLRQRLGSQLRAGMYDINVDAGRRNLGRSSIPMQSQTELARGLGESYADIEYGMEQKDRDAIQRARLAQIQAEPGLYQMEQAPRSRLYDVYAKQASA
jgi:hypothetical protein